MTAPKPTHKVALLLYPGADMLDFTGPAEILSSASYTRRPDPVVPVFEVIAVAADASTPTPSGNRATLHTQARLSIAAARARLADFSVLVVPGANTDVLLRMIAAPGGAPEVQLVRDFAALAGPTSVDARQERVLASVCTGALLLGAAGVLGGLPCTTSRLHLPLLAEVCAAAGAPAGKVCGEAEGARRNQRYVDAGVVREGLRIITAGGISSGLDASLRIIDVVMAEHDALMAKEKGWCSEAEEVAYVVEYDRLQIG